LATIDVLTPAAGIQMCAGSNGTTTAAGLGDVVRDAEFVAELVVVLAVAVGDGDVVVDIADGMGAGVASESIVACSRA
jgi:hypothetical protein